MDIHHEENTRVPAGKELLYLNLEDVLEKGKILSELEYADYKNSIVGSFVKFTGEIESVSRKDDKESVSIQIALGNRWFRGFFEVSLSQFPNVKLYKRGDVIEFYAIIKKFDYSCIDFEEVEIINWIQKCG